MNVAQALKRLLGELAVVAGEETAQQSRLLLSHVLRVRPNGLALLRERELSADEVRELTLLCARRLKHEPLQYILGEWEFMGLDFLVRPCALIPRQDTETLVELAIGFAGEYSYKTALDLCCGTGCIGISLNKLGGLEVTASDISHECVELTKENARRNDVNIAVIQGSFFEPFVSERFDIIVSNPPYIVSGELNMLQPELAYEPKIALDGGADGLDAYRVIKSGYEGRLNHGGMLLMEIGASQKEGIIDIFGQGTEFFTDIRGLTRVAAVRI